MHQVVDGGARAGIVVVEPAVGVRMDIDDPGHHEESVDVDFPPGGVFAETAYRNDTSVVDRHVGSHPRVARPVEYPPPAEDDVVFGLLGSDCGRGRRRDR